MATKPTLANARFGETAGGSTVGANLVAPSSGLRDTAFQGSTPAGSGYVNDLLHEAYLWFKWLDDGPDFTVNDLVVNGTLNVAGDAVFGTSVTLNTSLSVTSARTMTIPAAAMTPRNDGGLGATMNNTGYWDHNVSGASAIYVPIILPIGARITTATWFGAKTSATGTITVSLRSAANNGSGVTTIATLGSNNSNNPGNISIPAGVAINHTVAGGVSYFFRIDTSGQAGDATYAMTLQYDGVAV